MPGLATITPPAGATAANVCCPHTAQNPAPLANAPPHFEQNKVTLRDRPIPRSEILLPATRIVNAASA